MPHEEGGLDVDRVAFFSDAVFAIAMTILAVGIRVPVVRENQVGRAIRDLGPELASYFLSFAVIGLFWLAHHRNFARFRRVDTTVLVMNLLLLSLIALMPFPTDLIGRYGGSVPAVVFYAATVTAVGLASTAVWVYAASGHRLIDPDTPHRVIVYFTARGLSVPIVFGLSIPIAVVNPGAAKISWLLIIPLRVAYRRWLGPVDTYSS